MSGIQTFCRIRPSNTQETYFPVETKGRSKSPSCFKHGKSITPGTTPKSNQSSVTLNQLQTIFTSASGKSQLCVASEVPIKGKLIEASFKIDQDILEYNGFESAQIYKFNRVFNPTTSQKSVYNAFSKDFVPDFLSENNATFFLYGNEGCGKNYSLRGHEHSEQGLLILFCQDVLDVLELNKDKKQSNKLKLVTSIYGIHENEYIDLLSQHRPKLILDNDTLKLHDLSEHDVRFISEFKNLYRVAQNNVKQYSQQDNIYRENIHVVINLQIQKQSQTGDFKQLSQTNFVKLADSNIGGQRSQKTQDFHILSEVLKDLSIKKTNPLKFDSPLTRVLNDTLNIHSVVRIMAVVSSSPTNLANNQLTLSFCSKISNIPERTMNNSVNKNEVIMHKDLLKLESDMLQQADKLNTMNQYDLRCWFEEQDQKVGKIYQQLNDWYYRCSNRGKLQNLYLKLQDIDHFLCGLRKMQKVETLGTYRYHERAYQEYVKDANNIKKYQIETRASYENQLLKREIEERTLTQREQNVWRSVDKLTYKVNKYKSKCNDLNDQLERVKHEEQVKATFSHEALQQHQIQLQELQNEVEFYKQKYENEQQKNQDILVELNLMKALEQEREPQHKKTEYNFQKANYEVIELQKQLYQQKQRADQLDLQKQKFQHQLHEIKSSLATLTERENTNKLLFQQEKENINRSHLDQIRQFENQNQLNQKEMDNMEQLLKESRKQYKQLVKNLEQQNQEQNQLRKEIEQLKNTKQQSDQQLTIMNKDQDHFVIQIENLKHDLDEQKVNQREYLKNLRCEQERAQKLEDDIYNCEEVIRQLQNDNHLKQQIDEENKQHILMQDQEFMLLSEKYRISQELVQKMENQIEILQGQQINQLDDLEKTVLNFQKENNVLKEEIKRQQQKEKHLKELTFEINNQKNNMEETIVKLNQEKKKLQQKCQEYEYTIQDMIGRQKGDIQQIETSQVQDNDDSLNESQDLLNLSTQQLIEKLKILENIQNKQY